MKSGDKMRVRAYENLPALDDEVTILSPLSDRDKYYDEYLVAVDCRGGFRIVSAGWDFVERSCHDPDEGQATLDYCNRSHAEDVRYAASA